MDHFVMLSLWCASLSTNTRFRFLYFRTNNCSVHMMLHQEKKLPNNSGRPLSYNNFTDKKNGCYKKQHFFAFFGIKLSFHLLSFKIQVYK